MNIKKSDRHAKISGEFGEYFVLYWLSKFGFNCARVDHVGIDIYVFDQPMGISVKYKTLEEGKPSIGILKEDVEKAEITCEKFGWKPYMAFVFVNDYNPAINTNERITLFMCPTETLKEICTSSITKYRLNLREKEWAKYKENQDVNYITFEIDKKKWW